MCSGHSLVCFLHLWLQLFQRNLCCLRAELCSRSSPCGSDGGGGETVCSRSVSNNEAKTPRSSQQNTARNDMSSSLVLCCVDEAWLMHLWPEKQTEAVNLSNFKNFQNGVRVCFFYLQYRPNRGGSTSSCLSQIFPVRTDPSGSSRVQKLPANLLSVDEVHSFVSVCLVKGSSSE